MTFKEKIRKSQKDIGKRCAEFWPPGHHFCAELKETGYIENGSRVGFGHFCCHHVVTKFPGDLFSADAWAAMTTFHHYLPEEDPRGDRPVSDFRRKGLSMGGLKSGISQDQDDWSLRHRKKSA